MRFANDFHLWLRHSWKSLANRLTRDPKIVIHGNSCIILYFIYWVSYIILKVNRTYIISIINALLVSHRIGTTRATKMAAFWESQMLEFCNNNKIYTWNTFWTCLIRCVNMKWIRLVLWKTQSGQDSVHRRMDRRPARRRETSKAHFQLCWSRGYKNLQVIYFTAC